MSQQNNWFHFGSWKLRIDARVPVRFQSRLLLEHEIRADVLKLNKVTLRTSPVTKVDWSGNHPRVLDKKGTFEDFDLLIDASGRGSRMPAWLQESGYLTPEVEEVEVGVTYTSALYRPRNPRDYQALLIYPDPPHGRRAGGVLPVEGGNALVSLFGWCGEHAQVSDEGMLEFASTLPQPEIADFLQDAERLREFAVFRYKSARRLRYDKLRRFPPATCVLGDALCSVDPVFGQGMTLAALQAQLLESILKKASDPSEAARQFRKDSFEETKTAWLLSTGEDFRYPQVRGKRPFGLGVTHWYTAKVHQLAGSDPDVYRRFARVMNLLSGPEALFHPRIVTKVLRASLLPPKRVLTRPTRDSGT